METVVETTRSLECLAGYADVAPEFVSAPKGKTARFPQFVAVTRIESTRFPTFFATSTGETVRYLLCPVVAPFATTTSEDLFASFMVFGPFFVDWFDNFAIEGAFSVVFVSGVSEHTARFVAIVNIVVAVLGASYRGNFLFIRGNDNLLIF